MVLIERKSILVRYRNLVHFSTLVTSIAIAFFTATNAFGYTYLAGGKGQQRDSDGRIVFYRSEEVPKVEEKEKFEAGVYANFTDEEIYSAIAERVEALWNSVPGKFYTIEIVNDKSGTRDEKDKRNSITLFTPSESKSGGDARPVLGGDNKFIEDCDIRISRTLKPEEFGIVLAHEIGHCLGLGHEHKDLKAVMSYNRNTFHITLDDAAGAASIYPESNAGRNSDFVPCGTIAWDQLRPEQRKGAWLFQLFMLFLPLTVLAKPYFLGRKRRTSI